MIHLTFPFINEPTETEPLDKTVTTVKSLLQHLTSFKGYDEVQFKNSPSTQDIMTFMALEASQLQARTLSD
jgi:hypothetical protein